MNAAAIVFGFFLVVCGLADDGGVVDRYRGEAVVIGVIISVVGLLLHAGNRRVEKIGCLHVEGEHDRD